MSNQFSSDEEVLARLVREAGDPSVSPDPQYAETLRATILDRVGPAETVAHVTEGIRKADVIPITVERTRKMKRIAKLAVAATILVALGILVFWMTIGGGSTNIAFADVAKALDNLRTATYDCTMEMKNPMDGKTTTTTMKCFFLAPSRERNEMSMSMGSGKDKGSSIMILDHQAMKGLTLVPEQKLAIIDRPLEDKEARRTRRIRSRWCGSSFGRGAAARARRSSRLARRKSTGVWPSAFGPIATWQTDFLGRSADCPARPRRRRHAPAAAVMA